MAIATEPLADVGQPGLPMQVHRPHAPRPAWLSQHLGTALVLAVGGYALGHFIGNTIASGYANIAGASAENDTAIVLGFAFGLVGWYLGIGALNYPIAKLVGLGGDHKVE